MDCLVVDMVLTTNFDAPELCNRLADAGQVIPEDAHRNSEEVFRQVHRLLHRNRAFCSYLERYLDRLCACWLDEFAAGEPQAIAYWCNQCRIDQCTELGPMIWALARDSRPQVQGALTALLHRVLRFSLQKSQLALAPAAVTNP